jgi:glycosyltransferase involved in cell wall biosynthesis
MNQTEKLIEDMNKSICCIVPARNESGHLINVVNEVLSVEEIHEIIIVEGGSSDDTLQVAKQIELTHPKKVKVVQQDGKGKFNAVLEGSKMCTKDLILVWDADGTVPLEGTRRIIELSLRTGSPVIGDRLRGKISKGAMQKINWLGNWFFAFLWSPILRSKPTDMLCGTKIFPTLIFKEMPKWLIEHDPYGDFALVAFARARNLKVLSEVVDYNARSYGVTNINRWVGALQLFKTTFKVYVGFTVNKVFKVSYFHE